MTQRLGGLILAAALLAAGGASAAPMTMSGNAALSFAALVGAYSPALGAAQKHVLYRFLGGQTAFASSGAAITFHVNEVHCQLGDVDLTRHSCRITYGAHVTVLNGEEGANILANMALAGVMGDGAAGTIHYDITGVACTIKVAEVKSPDGGGASCTYTQ
jgi:hypothetical protein